MGRRGIRSTAEKVLGDNDKPTWKGKPPWTRKGLSRAERVIRFCECLPITSGKLAGTRMKLRPWQQDIVRKIYATDADGRRRVRTAVISLPRKNGKTQLVAALLAAHMGMGPESEMRGQCYSGAADRNQAALIFNELEAIIQATPEFRGLFNIRSFRREIECLTTGTIYTCLSADHRKAHGLNPSFIVVDEAAQIPASTLWDNLSSGVGAREEPLSIVISTQSPDPLHFLQGLIDYGDKIATGELPPDPAFLLIKYAADMADDVWDEATWFKANPALNDFRSLEEMRIFAEQAKKIPQKEAVFKSLYLNLPVSADARFVPVEDWLECQGTAECTGPCFMGLDLGSTRDLTALAAYWPETGAVKVWCWLPGDPPLSDRSQSDKVPYTTWEKEGFIETWPGKATDHRAAALRLAELCAQHDVVAIGFDRWRIDQMLLYVEEIGAKLPLEPHGQGFKDFSPAIEALERLILAHALHCDDNPVLTWAMGNVAVLTDPAGGRKFDKAGAKTRRIDPAVALAMAVGIAARMAKPEALDFECSLMTM